MCMETTIKHKNSKVWHISSMYLLATCLGFLSAYSGFGWLQTFASAIAEIFMNIFKFISLPIIGLSIIVTFAHLSSDSGMNKIWQRTLLYTLSTTVIAAAVACILFLLVKPNNIGSIVSMPSSAVDTGHGFLKHIINIFPNNIVTPFLEHNVLSVLLVAIVIGVAIRYISDVKAKNTVNLFFKGLHSILLVITSWIIKIMPLGLFGFISVTITEIRGGVDIKGLGAYLSIIVLANLVQGFIVLPVWLYLNKIKPFKTMYGMLPALSVAFFSKSSAGTLPITMQSAENNVGINSKISRFVLPLCTTINMNGCAAFIFVTVIYLMQNHGIEITGLTMATWIIVATIAAIGNAGVPMGCFFLSASLLSSMNVPITLLGIILPFYGLIDMLETSLNVWSDACVAIVVNEKELAVAGATGLGQPAT